jgi:hypothetical protein
MTVRDPAINANQTRILEFARRTGCPPCTWIRAREAGVHAYGPNILIRVTRRDLRGQDPGGQADGSPGSDHQVRAASI